MTNQELFLQKYEYKPDGTLINKITGKIAGGPTQEGYIRIRLNSVEYRAHRIIWEMFNGEIPEGMLIDHINGIKNDNRLENLRMATRMQNNANRIGRRNAEFPKGVSRAGKKFRAKLFHNGHTYCLGSYATPEEAAEAYNKKSIEIHGEFSITTRKII